MSYDFYIVRKDIPEDCASIAAKDAALYLPSDDHVERGKYFNCTYNYSPFFHAYHVCPSHDLDGLTACECADRIDKALPSIEKSTVKELTERYYMQDGQVITWGSINNAIGFLKQVREYCLLHPEFVCMERS